jgi:gliding motility-associated-like protein
MKKFTLKCFLRFLFLLFLTMNSYAKIFTVTNANDAGIASLRQAIMDANARIGMDTITFALPNSLATKTIRLSSVLPKIMDPIFIDGTTQTGYVSSPLICVNFNVSGAGLNVFEFASGADKSTLKGLAVAGGNRAVFINGANSINILKNYIGTDSTGTVKGVTVPTWTIFEIFDAINTSIRENVISGSNESGLKFNTGNCSGSIVIGNYIGTDKTGLLPLPNSQAGIFVSNQVNFSNSKIGGSTPDSSNVIAKNGQQGIFFPGGAGNFGTGISIVRNFIGLNKNGAPLGNGSTGLEINNVKSLSLLKNTVSYNAGIGINLTNTSAIIVGDTVYKNTAIGINITNGAGCTITYNTIGGNLQSGLNLTASPSALIKGNVVYGSGWDGISLNTCRDAVIQGNTIGLLADAFTAAADSGHGILVNNSSKHVIIGGNSLADRNIIASNNGNGINFDNGSDSSLVQGNYIGMDVSGKIIRGQKGNGVLVSKSLHVTIGGGSTGQGNVISGNKGNGILAIGASNYLVVQGNYLGVDVTGAVAAPNSGSGVAVDASKYALIGGTTPMQRNIASSNLGNGITLINRSDSSFVQGNYAGLDVTGINALGNTGDGITIAKSRYVTVGGSGYTTRNVIGASKGNGISIGDSANFCVVKGNFSGLNANGGGSVAAIGNRGAGIFLNSVSDVTVGGSITVERNVFSQNGFLLGDINTAGGSDGMRVQSCTKLFIVNNYCGTDTSGMKKMGNRWGGISLNESSNSTISGNIASGNLNEGIYIRNNGSTKPQNLLVTGNLIGVGSDKKTAIGNEDYGINLGLGGNLNNTISGNTIAYTGSPFTSNPSYGSGGAGILNGPNSKFNLFTQNSIFCNLSGISIDAGGNEAVMPPTLIYSDNTIASGKAAPGNTVDVYNNPGACNCQGKVYLGATIADASGNWTFTHNLGSLASGITATQTTTLKSTSAFSPCCPSPKIVAQPMALKAICSGGSVTFSGNSNTGSVYKWIEKKVGASVYTALTDGGVYSNVNTNSLTITNAPAFMDRYEYKLIVVACKPDTSARGVLRISKPVPAITGDSVICAGTSLSLVASGAKSYAWSPALGLNNTDKESVMASPAKTTLYSLLAKDSIGCLSDSLKRKIAVKNSPMVLVPKDTTILTGGTFTVNLKSAETPVTSYSWVPSITLGNPTGASEGGGTVISQTLFNADNLGSQYTYTVTGTADGCMSFPVKFKVNVVGGVKIPDIFSPNNDGKNDYFTFTGTSRYNLTILDRWGVVMYEGNEHSNKWDGRAPHGDYCSDGTYYYMLKAADLNNKEFNGFVTLVK